MPKDPRPFITVHDGMPEHPKIEPLSDAAFRLLMETWCWCHRNKTDGRIPTASWTKRGTSRARAELLAAELAEHVAGEVVMHDYLEHQESADEIAEKSERRRAAGRKGGKAKANGLANARAGAKQNGGKSVADVDVEEEPNGSSSDAPRLDVERVCQHLADKIEGNGSKRPGIGKKWRDAARLAMDSDGRTERQLHNMIDWCQGHEFWRSNILSMPTLREKYDQMRLKATAAEKPRGPSVDEVRRAASDPLWAARHQ